MPDSKFTLKTSVQVGIQMIDRLEALHALGYLHMDIKPENILIENNEFTNLSSCNLKMIDFGLTMTFRDSKGNHVSMSKQADFRGNILFASKNALQYKTQSRRDDCIAIFYLMVYLADKRNQWIERYMDKNDKNYFKVIERIKANKTPL